MRRRPSRPPIGAEPDSLRRSRPGRAPPRVPARGKVLVPGAAVRGPGPVVGVWRRVRRPRAVVSAAAGRLVAVVSGPLLRIGEDRVGLVDEDELFLPAAARLGRRGEIEMIIKGWENFLGAKDSIGTYMGLRIFADVWMKIHGKFFEGRFYLCAASTPIHTK